MTKAAALLTLSFSLALLAGCRQNSPTPAPITEPKANVSPQQPKGSDQDPTKLDCKAISDPAAAEDCRFRKEVAADKKKHNSNYVVKHSSGSIKQP
jgi:hypothetical protein